MDVLIGVALTLLTFWNLFNTLFGYGTMKLLGQGAELTAKGFEEVDEHAMGAEQRIKKLEERVDAMGSGLNALSVEVQSRVRIR